MPHQVQSLGKVMHLLTSLLQKIQQHCTQSRIKHRPRITVVGPCASSTFSFLDAAPIASEGSEDAEIAVYFPEFSELLRSGGGRHVTDYSRAPSVISQCAEFDSTEHRWTSHAMYRPYASKADPASIRTFNEPQSSERIVIYDFKKLEYMILDLLNPNVPREREKDR